MSCGATFPQLPGCCYLWCDVFVRFSNRAAGMCVGMIFGSWVKVLVDRVTLMLALALLPKATAHCSLHNPVTSPARSREAPKGLNWPVRPSSIKAMGFTQLQSISCKRRTILLGAPNLHRKIKLSLYCCLMMFFGLLWDISLEGGCSSRNHDGIGHVLLQSFEPRHHPATALGCSHDGSQFHG